MPVSNARVRGATAQPRNVTSVGVQSPLLGLLTHVQDCPRIGAADENGASRQPTSRQNRRPEAADRVVIPDGPGVFPFPGIPGARE